MGSRASSLALRQTDQVLERLRPLYPDLDFQVVTVTTHGDANVAAPLAGMGLGVFVKEIEQQLLSGQLDMAVHSLKDMPTLLPEGLALAALLPREDPRDVLVNRWGCSLEQLPADARIGTSSPPPPGALLSRHPNLTVTPIRGNVETRLRKAGGGGVRRGDSGRRRADSPGPRRPHHRVPVAARVCAAAGPGHPGRGDPRRRWPYGRDIAGR